MGHETGVVSTRLSPIGAASEDAHLLRRADLAALLRFKRSRVALTEEERAADRRRVQGLRREEVAERAGISGTWYTWLEQGRVINVSEESLRRICSALELTPVEASFALDLIRTNDVPPCVLQPPLPCALRAIVESYGTSAAFVLGPRFDILAWNEWSERIFGYNADTSPIGRNVIWRFFNDPAQRMLFDDWHSLAGPAVSEFRRSYERYRGEAAFEELLSELLQNAEFERLWNAFTVLPRSAATRVAVTHPIYGKLRFEATTASLNAIADCALVMYAPVGD